MFIRKNTAKQEFLPGEQQLSAKIDTNVCQRG